MTRTRNRRDRGRYFVCRSCKQSCTLYSKNRTCKQCGGLLVAAPEKMEVARLRRAEMDLQSYEPLKEQK